MRVGGTAAQSTLCINNRTRKLKAVVRWVQLSSLVKKAVTAQLKLKPRRFVWKKHLSH